jgi:3-methyladenine DNA glycosylase AlkD
VLRWLERHGERSTVEGMARYGIPSEGAYGVTFGELRRFATELGRDHALAQGLWASGRYEARLLAALVDEPAAVSVGQMNAWAGDFDSWAICDTVCFHLFDRTPHAWSRVKAWAGASALYRKRAAFALLWGLTVHDRAAADRMFLICLPLIEKAALDERELVKKGVDMALRAVGKRKRDAAADRGRPGRIPRTRAGRGSRLDREERAPRALRPVRRVAD